MRAYGSPTFEQDAARSNGARAPVGDFDAHPRLLPGTPHGYRAVLTFRQGDGRLCEAALTPMEASMLPSGAALSGELDTARLRTDPNFGFEVHDPAARNLADRFRRNFTQFVAHADESVRAAAPPGIFDA